MIYRIRSLRRYPVKSMGGESLQVASLDERGLAGDRWYAVADEGGHFASGKNTRRFRRRDAVFDFSARTEASGVVAVTRGTGCWAVGDSDLDQELSNALKAQVRVTSEGAVPHQDMGAVSLVGTATLDWCRERWNVNADPRRLRVNIVLETDEPFIEEACVDEELRFPDAGLRIVERIPRCRTVDINQDCAVAEGRWLKPLAAKRNMFLGVYAEVSKIGQIRVGEAARVT